MLILGSGPMGLLSQIVSKSKSALTVATEINPYRLAFAREISDFALTPSQLNQATVDEICEGHKFDLIIDTVGTQLEMAEKWIERGGVSFLLVLMQSTGIPFLLPNSYSLQSKLLRQANTATCSRRLCGLPLKHLNWRSW